MTCAHVRDDLSGLLDDELSAARAREVRAHLDACPVCREDLEALCRLSEALAARLEPDPGFIVRFRERRDRTMGDAAEWRLWRRLAVRLAPLAAAAVLGMAAGLWLSGHRDQAADQVAVAGVGEVVGIEDLERLEWGNAQAFATEEVMARPVLHIAMEPFPGGEP